MKISELKSKLKKPSSTLIIGCKESEFPSLQKMFEDIKVKDPTFEFISKRSRYQNSDYVFLIKCSDKNNAFKRGTWITQKLKEKNISLLYQVKGGEANE